MADYTEDNKQGFENTDPNNQTKAFLPVDGTPDTQTAPKKSRNEFVDGSRKDLPEKCEERGSIDDCVASTVWRVLRPLLILLVSLALLVYIGVSIFNNVEESYFLPVNSESSETKAVEIKSGSSLSTIATVLYENGMIRNKFVFQMYVDFNDMGSKLVAGTYTLSPAMTMEQIVDILSQGDGGREIVKVTFTEGMTAEDMADTLVKNGVFNNTEKQEFLNLCNDADAFSDYDFIKALKTTANLDERRHLLEGYLFPDTYEIYKDAKPEDVINKLLKRFDNVWTVDYDDQAQKMGMSVDQVVTLASMIEWEAQNQDFKKVSAVFHNRLGIEMPLQSCATLRYVTGEKKLAYTKEEISTESPYNTYQIAGLPIGPVSNPGKKAIEAALYPDEGFMAEGYLYFCNKDPKTGELVFAKTLEEQNANKEAFNELTQSDTYNTDETN